MKTAVSFGILFIVLSCSSKYPDNTIIPSVSGNFQKGSGNEISKTFSIYADTSVNIDPSSTPFSGNLYYKSTWNDSNGRNLFIISKRLDYQEGEGKAEIFAYHYLNYDKNWELFWKTYDHVEGNGCDLAINVPKDLIQVTDLDSNNIAETSYLYTLDNRCDAVVVPAKMILHVGKEKYAIRGFTELHLGPSEEVMNNYLKEAGLKEVKYKKLEPNVNQLPPSLQNYLHKTWNDFVTKEEN